MGLPADVLRPISAAAQLELDHLPLHLDQGNVHGFALVNRGPVPGELSIVLFALNVRQAVGAKVHSLLGRRHVHLQDHVGALEALPQVAFTLRHGGHGNE